MVWCRGWQVEPTLFNLVRSRACRAVLNSDGSSCVVVDIDAVDILLLQEFFCFFYFLQIVVVVVVVVPIYFLLLHEVGCFLGLDIALLVIVQGLLSVLTP